MGNNVEPEEYREIDETPCESVRLTARSRIVRFTLPLDRQNIENVFKMRRTYLLRKGIVTNLDEVVPGRTYYVIGEKI